MDKGHKIENEIYRLISLKLSGDATDKDLVRLQDLLTEHPAYQFLYDQLTEGATLNHNNDDLTAQAFAVHYTKKLQLDMCEEQGTTTETSKPKIATRRKYVLDEHCSGRICWNGVGNRISENSIFRPKV